MAGKLSPEANKYALFPQTAICTFHNYTYSIGTWWLYVKIISSYKETDYNIRPIAYKIELNINDKYIKLHKSETEMNENCADIKS